MAYINGFDRNQVQMITASLDDFIAQDNPVRVIDAYVNSLDLKKLGFIVYDGNNKGQAPYRCSDLLKLHIYGYMNKVRSSRSLEAEAKRNLELMWLVNGITPDHGTIAGFVKKNKKAFHQALRDLTLILKGWGLIDGKLVAIDGTKIRAQNSKSNCITLSGLEKKIAYAEEQIEAYLAVIAQQEENEAELRELIEVYQQMKETYKAQQEELRKEGLEQITLTDPDSRRMKNNGAMDVCYNVQAVIDGKNHFAIEAEATSDINDLNQLSHMAQKAKDLVQPDKIIVQILPPCINCIQIRPAHFRESRNTAPDPLQKSRFQRRSFDEEILQPEHQTFNFHTILRHLITEFLILELFNGRNLSGILNRSQILPFHQRSQILLALLHSVFSKIWILYHLSINILLIHPVFQFFIILIKNAHNAPVSVNIIRI